MSANDPHHSTRRLGQGMIALGFAVAIVLLTLFFGGLERRAQNPNMDPDSQRLGNGIIEVYLDRNRAGHYVMRGDINGVQTDFILDTGATDVVIPPGLARRAGLREGYAGQAMTANGVVTVYSTRIERLTLGAIELRDIRASINPAMDERTVLLGMSALREVEFHQRDGQLTLRYAPPTP